MQIIMDETASLRPKIEGIARSRKINESEFFHDVQARCWERGSQLRDGSKVGPWILQVAKNAANENYRKLHGTKLGKLCVPLTPATEESFRDDTRSPEEELICHERKTVLRSEIEKLPPKYRDVIQSVYLRGEELVKYAARIGCKLSTCAARCKRARERLRQSACLREYADL